MTAYSVDTFELSRSVGYLTKQVHQDARALVEPLFADTGVSYTEWSGLISILYGAGATCAALSREIGHDMGATSRMIAALADRGLITRERSDDDRRVVHLALTPAGRALAISGRDQLIEQWNRWLADWSPADVEGLIAALRRLRATLGSAREAVA